MGSMKVVDVVIVIGIIRCFGGMLVLMVRMFSIGRKVVVVVIFEVSLVRNIIIVIMISISSGVG